MTFAAAAAALALATATVATVRVPVTVPRPAAVMGRRRRSSAEVAADRAMVARIREALANPRAVVRAIEALFARQTRDEQREFRTRHHNSVGFCANDAARGSALAVKIAERRAEGRPEHQLLTVSELETARRIASRYAGTQLLALAKEKARRAASLAILDAVAEELEVEARVEALEDEYSHRYEYGGTRAVRRPRRAVQTPACPAGCVDGEIAGFPCCACLHMY